MKLFKRHIDKSRDQAELPEEFAWENMQSDIYDKMSERNLAKGHNPNKFITILFMCVAVLLTWSIISSVFEIGDGNDMPGLNLVESKIENYTNDQKAEEAADYPKDQRIKLDASKTSQLQKGKTESIVAELAEGSVKENLSKATSSYDISNNHNETQSLGRRTTVTEGSILHEIDKPISINKQLIRTQNSDFSSNTNTTTNSTSNSKPQNEIVDGTNDKLNSQRAVQEKGSSQALSTNPAIASSDLDKSSGTDINSNNPQSGLADSISSSSTHNYEPAAASSPKDIKGVDNTKSLAMIGIPHIQVSNISILEYAYQLESIPSYAIVDVADPEGVDRFTIGLGFGTNNWGLNFSQLQDGSKKSSTEKTRFGTFGSVDLEYRLNDRFYIATGIQNTKLTSRFNKVAIRNYTETHTDQLIEEETNPITGSVKKIYGDVELNVIETRRVQHYNSFDLISVPFVIGYRTKVGSLNPSIGLGLAYNLSMKTNGKTEMGDSILDYSDGLNTPYNPKVGVSPLMRLGLSYYLRNGFVLSLDGQYQHSIKQWNSTESFTSKPRVLNLGLKVGKSF